MPRDDPAEELDRLADEAADRLEDGAPEEAIEAARRGRTLARRAGDEDAGAHFSLLEGMALAELGRPGEALSRFDEVLAARPDDADARVERGLALFELCRFDEARRALEDALAGGDEDAWAEHTLGLLGERRGDAAEAERRFARARRIAPEAFPPPVSLSPERFDAALEAALASLPAEVRDYLENVAITVEDFPQAEDLAGSDPPLSPTILGLFRGAPLGDKASQDPWSHFPSSIVLYQKNLERLARDEDELVDEIGVTLVHEVGHFLGLDEDELWERGLD